MADGLPLNDQQWAIFRARMEALAEEAARTGEHQLNAAEFAEVMLLLMDRIDHLEKRITDAA